jgi:hypothetical protein
VVVVPDTSTVVVMMLLGWEFHSTSSATREYELRV